MRAFDLSPLLLTVLVTIPAAGLLAADALANVDTSSLVNECILKAPPAEVWRVWSTGDGYKALGVTKAEVDLRVGGLIRSHYKQDGVLGDDGTIHMIGDN